MRALFLITLLACVQCATGREVHVLPRATGRADGTGWENALGANAVQEIVSKGLKAGDRLLLGSGTYLELELEIRVSGTAEQPVIIEGIDRGGELPLITGKWSEHKPDKGSIAVEFGHSASHIILRGLRFRDHQMAVLAPPAKGGSVRAGLRFENISITRVRHGFYLSDCRDLVLENCQVRRCTKHAFRFESGCVNVTVRHCEADCSEGDAGWERLTEPLPFGFFANGRTRPNQTLLFEDCVARNHLMPHQTSSYKNGDGFVVEETTTGVTFLRCRAFRNQDGGFDLKPPDVVLKGCVAGGNSRNFRIWTTATLEDCFSGYAPTGLWCDGGPVTVTRSTFYSLSHAAVETDDHARAPVTLRNCLLGAVKEPRRATGSGRVNIDASNIHDPATNAPRLRLVAPDSKWQGNSDAMNSRAFPEKGYRFMPVDPQH